MPETIVTGQFSIVQALRPSAQHIELLGSGDINDVVRVDDEVFRFPKNDEGRQMLRYEQAVLAKLAGRVSLQIPAVHELADDASYGIFSYVPGQVLPHDQLAGLDTTHKQAVARMSGTFMKELNDVLSVEETARLRRQFVPFWQDEDEYFEGKLHQAADAPYHGLYETYYRAYRQRIAMRKPSEIVLYGDFHAGNMIFDDNMELSGLIDFGDTGPGTVNNELRQLYMVGQDVARAVAAELDDRFGPVDMEAVRLYAIMNEFSVLLRPESQPPNQNPRADIARRLLKQWLGDNWETKQ